MESLIVLGAVAVGLSLVMIGAWIIAARPGRTAWADTIWALSTGLAGVIVALLPYWEVAGPRAWLMITLITIWSLRLGTGVTHARSRNVNNPRFAELRRMWGRSWEGRLFLFLQVQALASWLMLLAVWGAAHDPAPFPAWSDYAGAGLLFVSIFGSLLADHQIKAFFAVRNNDGKVCAKGLWGLSRHPDFFFQWLGWVAYGFFAIGPNAVIGLDWLALLAPVLVYILLVHITGIPPLESHMLRTRGDLYQDVQRRVRTFWPIPRFGNGQD